MIISYLLLIVLTHFVVGLLCVFYFLWMAHRENIEYNKNEKLLSSENLKVSTKIFLYGFASLLIIIAIHDLDDRNNEY